MKGNKICNYLKIEPSQKISWFHLKCKQNLLMTPGFHRAALATFQGFLGNQRSQPHCHVFSAILKNLFPGA